MQSYTRRSVLLLSPPAIVTWLCLLLASSAGAQATPQPAPAPAANPQPYGAQPGQPYVAPAQPGQPYVAPAQPGQPYGAPAQPGQPYYGQPPAYGQPQGQPPAYGQPQAYPPPQQPYPPPAPAYKKPRPRISKGMMIGGISLLGASYLVGMLTGAILVDVDRNECRECREVGGFLFIPVIGPFLAINPARNAEGLLAMYGLVQVTGAALMIGGIVKYRHSKRAAEEQGFTTFKLPHGRSLSVDVAATPYKLGPQLSMRF